MASKKTWAPRSYPVRDPRRPSQANGRIINPPRALKFGGVGEEALINTAKRRSGTAGPNGVGPVSSRGGGN